MNQKLVNVYLLLNLRVYYLADLGSEFCTYCLVTSVLPAIQRQLNNEKKFYVLKRSQQNSEIKSSSKVLKQCLGAFIQLSVDLLIPGIGLLLLKCTFCLFQFFVENRWRECLLTRMLQLLIQCIAFSRCQFIALFGCSFLKHILLKSIDSFSLKESRDDWPARFWNISSQFVWKAMYDIFHLFSVLLSFGFQVPYSFSY